MTSLSDTLTVGLVLVLLFGSIALYLYTRIQQSERKISLLESILLDLKMNSEVSSYEELPASEAANKSGGNYASFEEDDKDWYPGASVKDLFPNSNVTPPISTPNVRSPPNSPSPSVSSNVNDDDMDVEQYKSVIAEAVNDISDTPVETIEIVATITDSASKVSSNYESMTIKELQTLAKTRGITGAGSMKKNAVIEALKTSDRSQTVEPGSLAPTSFLETSSSFQSSAESQ